MKKTNKKDTGKGNSMKGGKKGQQKRKKEHKNENVQGETPMEHDAGNQDGSAGLSGTSAI